MLWHLGGVFNLYSRAPCGVWGKWGWTPSLGDVAHLVPRSSCRWVGPGEFAPAWLARKAGGDSEPWVVVLRHRRQPGFPDLPPLGSHCFTPSPIRMCSASVSPTCLLSPALPVDLARGPWRALTGWREGGRLEIVPTWIDVSNRLARKPLSPLFQPDHTRRVMHTPTLARWGRRRTTGRTPPSRTISSERRGSPPHLSSAPYLLSPPPPHLSGP